MTQTGSWVIAVGVLVWFRGIEPPEDRAFWAFWTAWSAMGLLAFSLALHSAYRISGAMLLFIAGFGLVFAGVILSLPETVRCLPLHALAVAAIVFLWIRLAANVSMPDDGMDRRATHGRGAGR